MRPSKPGLWQRLFGRTPPFEPIRCATPSVQMNGNNPSAFVRCTNEQTNGTTILEDEYLADGHRKVSIIPPQPYLPTE
jgi:hypothetical protein